MKLHKNIEEYAREMNECITIEISGNFE